MSASSLPITQLGSTIKAHITTAEKYADKQEQHYKAAGLHLIEAKQRIEAGEYDGSFSKFITQECNCLSSSRAYELISIANGTKTVTGIREEVAGRVRKSRAAARASESPLRNGQRPIDKCTGGPALAQRRSAVLAEVELIRRTPGYEEEIEPPEEGLIRQITATCTGLPELDLKLILIAAQTARQALVV